MGGGMHVGGMRAAHFSGSGFAVRILACRILRTVPWPPLLIIASTLCFVGAPFAYAPYDSCWRRVWTPYGLQWVDVCGNYGY